MPVVARGDRLDPWSRAFDGFDARLVRVRTAEVAAESRRAPDSR
jgi:hypothetical protein